MLLEGQVLAESAKPGKKSSPDLANGNAGRWNLVEPREEGVDCLNLDNRETLVFWTRWLKSKGKDTIIRRLKRDKVQCI